MRAIDADVLIKFIDNRYDITWKDDYEGGIKDACTDILEKINKMLTITQPKTGHWVKAERRGCVSYSKLYAECDQCHEVVISGWDYNYCPNCGAKMEAKNEVEEARNGKQCECWNKDKQQAINYLYSSGMSNEQVETVVNALTERETGHWVGIDDFPFETWECDRCGFIAYGDDAPSVNHYCPNCGAKMEADDEKIR